MSPVNRNKTKAEASSYIDEQENESEQSEYKVSDDENDDTQNEDAEVSRHWPSLILKLVRRTLLAIDAH
ncbi:unnamed protein product [Phytophthora fragariaefolia]|uniref:Unnamed protein product n=1 Tax=Phytophthora fragariaefolia TaxID=1490495 RepID=A0A9W6UCN5_9STRA|nr:unnamed protein product [Phytophthora fragariaefolia]